MLPLLFALPCFAGTLAAWAQPYPNKAVRLVVPYVAGGSTDAIARVVAASLAAQLNQTFVVENRPGAAGVIAHDIVAKANADGYTLLFSAAGPLTVTPHTYATIPYQPVKSFMPVKLIATALLLLVVHPKIKATTVKELIAEAQARPGKLSYGSFGTGSAAHLAGELFKSLAHVDMAHVPYKGGAPALIDLVGGHIDLMFDVLLTALPQVKAGRLRPLAITSATRSSLMPEVPSMQEAGVKDFDAGTWWGLLTPAATSQQIIGTLSQTLDKILAQPEFRTAMTSQGGVVGGGTPAQFGAFFQSEFVKWGKVVRSTGIKLE
jgi:tripartite-type tricarboxylate transporter receptor subunit TctC